MSRRPRVVPCIDCEPWFECLSFSKGVPSKDCGIWISWRHLPPPPFFPSFLNPYEFRNPPEISVSSYAVLGSYILISPQPEMVVGTHAFHVVNKTWEKIHDENLPFVGQAVHVGGSLFAAGLVSNKTITGSASLFCMSIDDVSSSTSDAAVSTPSLSIQELKVVASSEDKIPWPLFCPMGKGRFCLIRVVSYCRRRRHKPNHLKKRLQVSLTALRIENIEAIMARCQSQDAKDLIDAEQVNEQGYRCKSKSLYGMAVVAALSMIVQEKSLSKVYDTGKIK